ncbi:uncharacterized protein EAF02_004902 [Botrytis sinoallii]|uniref:uncharacterized protein n=1 Tax=Botrytis sinoallii TaxID=1463999 RepID=UPI00190020E4|nr:uncharacterized protein EAF02_004902 [Botrytis sinoallii]KAF7884566.1 hypothetical protein EAF02_004902 [Botrytis sinoallii]
MKEILVSRQVHSFICCVREFQSLEWTLALGSGEFQGLTKVKRCPASRLPGPSVRHCKEMANW